MKMKTVQCAASLVVVLGVSFMLFQDNWVARAAEKKSQCVACHTSARSLIKITREIAERQKGKPGATVKSEGEG